MQLPLDGVQAGHGRLEEARLDDANVDSEVVYIPPYRRKEHIRYSTAEGMRSAVYYDTIYYTSLLFR